MADKCNLKEELDATILEFIEECRRDDVDAKQKAILSDCIAKLCHAKIEFDRAENDFEDKSARIKMEDDWKKREFEEKSAKDKMEDERKKEEQKQERKQFAIGILSKVGVAAAGIAFACWQNTASIRFEETGIWKSPTVKDIFRSTKPRIKMDI